MSHDCDLKLLCVVVLLTLSLAGCKPDNAVPDQIQGHWVTDAAGYDDRYLQLEKDFVLIGVEKDEIPSIQRVSRVETERDGAETAYTIYSSGPQQDYDITLYFNPAKGGELRIKNQKQIVWRRQAATPSEEP